MSDGDLRTIIVDDEPPARRGLLELLEVHRNVRVIGEADSVANAASLCKELRPDLLFLDIELDDGLGFSLLPKLQPVPSIIFATAHNEFAVRAFEVNAIDYLLKPIMPDRLAHALERIHYREQAEFAHKLRESDQVFLESSTTARMVYLSEVAAITAEENYTEVWLRDGGSVLIRRTMSDWANALPTPMFDRPHRSLIVNVQAVKKLSKTGKGDVDVEIIGMSEPVRLGKKSASRLRQALSQPNHL